jgi:hypothetical protein
MNSTAKLSGVQLDLRLKKIKIGVVSAWDSKGKEHPERIPFLSDYYGKGSKTNSNADPIFTAFADLNLSLKANFNSNDFIPGFGMKLEKLDFDAVVTGNKELDPFQLGVLNFSPKSFVVTYRDQPANKDDKRWKFTSTATATVDFREKRDPKDDIDKDNGCDGSLSMTLGMGFDDFNFSASNLDWNFKVNKNENLLACKIAGFGVEVKNMQFSSKGLKSTDYLKVTMNREVSSMMGAKSGLVAFKFNQFSWIYSGLPTWSSMAIENYKGEFAVQLFGMKLNGDVDYTELFGSYPGIGLSNIVFNTGKNMGNVNIPTGLNLTINSKSPYVHIEGGLPRHINLSIPEITFSDAVRGSAKMKFGLHPEDSEYKGAPFFHGEGKISMPGAISGMAARLKFVRPSKINKTGIEEIAVRIDLSPSSHIPLGNTGFYITSLAGAFYDGLGQPESSKQCVPGGLAPGMKGELAVFIQEKINPQSPGKLARGSVGIWVQFNRLAFGIAGQVLLVDGIAKAAACAAITNGGSVFRARMDVTMNIGLKLKGQFGIDVWKEKKGAFIAGFAEVSVYVKKGAIIKKWWLKIPPGGFSTPPRFTKFGAFKNGKKGFTVGMRIFGYSFGASFLDGKLGYGKVNYPLAQPPAAKSQADIIDSDYESFWRPAKQDANGTPIYDLERSVSVSGGEEISVVAVASTTQWEKRLYAVIVDAQGHEHPIIWDALPKTIETTSGAYIVGRFSNMNIDGAGGFLTGDVKVKVGKLDHTIENHNKEANDDQLVQVGIFLSPVRPEITSLSLTTSSLVAEEYFLNATIENFQSDITRNRYNSTTKYWLNQFLAPTLFYSLARGDELESSLVLSEPDTSIRLIPVDIARDISNWTSCQSINGTTLTLNNCLLSRPSVGEGTYNVALGIEYRDSLDKEFELLPPGETASSMDTITFFTSLEQNGKEEQYAEITVPVRETEFDAPTIFSAIQGPVGSNKERSINVRWAPFEGQFDGIDAYQLEWWAPGQGTTKKVIVGKDFQYEFEVASRSEINASEISTYIDDDGNTKPFEVNAMVKTDYIPQPQKPNNTSLLHFKNEEGAEVKPIEPEPVSLDPSVWTDIVNLSIKPVKRSISDKGENANFVSVYDKAGNEILPLVLSQNVDLNANLPTTNHNKIDLQVKKETPAGLIDWDGVTAFEIPINSNLAVPIFVGFDSWFDFTKSTIPNIRQAPYLFGQYGGQIESSPSQDLMVLSPADKENALKTLPKLNTAENTFIFLTAEDEELLLAGQSLPSRSPNQLADLGHLTYLTFRPENKTVLCGDLHSRIPAYKMKEENIALGIDPISKPSLWEQDASGKDIPLNLTAESYDNLSTNRVFSKELVLDLDAEGKAQPLIENGKLVYIDELPKEKQVGANADKSYCSNLRESLVAALPVGVDESTVPPAREIPLQIRSAIGEYEIGFHANNMIAPLRTSTVTSSPSHATYVKVPVMLTPPKPSFQALQFTTASDEIDFERAVEEIVHNRSNPMELFVDDLSVLDDEAIDGKTYLKVFDVTLDENNPVLLWSASIDKNNGSVYFENLSPQLKSNSIYDEQDQIKSETNKILFSFDNWSGADASGNQATLFEAVEATSHQVSKIRIGFVNSEKWNKNGALQGHIEGPMSYALEDFSYIRYPEKWECASLTLSSADQLLDESIKDDRSNYQGIYPDIVPTNDDFVFSFSTIYDLNKDHWVVDVYDDKGVLLQGDIKNYKLKSDGFYLNFSEMFPGSDVAGSASYANKKFIIKVKTKNIAANNTNCPVGSETPLVGSIGTVNPLQEATIEVKGDLFRISNITPGYEVEYAFGRGSNRDWFRNIKFSTYPYWENLQRGDWVEIPQSGLMTISLRSKALFSPRRHLQFKHVHIDKMANIYDDASVKIAPISQPDLYPISGNATLGSELFIFPEKERLKSSNESRYICKWNEGDNFLCPTRNNALVINKGGKNTLRVWNQTSYIDLDGNRVRYDSKPVVLDVNTERVSQPQVVQANCYTHRYPQLVKLKGDQVAQWTSVEWQKLRDREVLFYDFQGGALDYEIEKVDEANQTAWAWVSSPEPMELESSRSISFGFISTPQSANTSLWDNNYRGVYHLAEGQSGPYSNGTKVPIALNSNHTLSVTDVVANGLGLKSTNSSLELLSNENFLSPWDEGFTWSSWIRQNDLSTLTQDLKIVENTLFNLVLRPNGALHLQFQNTEITSIENTFLAGEWNHVAVVFDRVQGKGELKLVLNGQEVMVKKGKDLDLINWSEQNLFKIGDGIDFIDEVRFSGEAISSKWLEWDYILQHPLGQGKENKTNCALEIYGLQEPHFTKHCNVQVGDFVHKDTRLSISTLAEELKGGVLIKTPNHERNSQSKEYMSFYTHRGAMVYVLIEAGAMVPDFLQRENWVKSNLSTTSSHSQLKDWDVWQKAIGSKVQVNLSAPSHEGLTNVPWSYPVIVKPYVKPVLNACGTLTPGGEVYSDRNWQIASVYDFANEYDVLCTEQDEYSSSSENSFSFSLTDKRYIYVGIDNNASGQPAFLDDGWAQTGGSVYLGLEGHKGYTFYRKSYNPGSHNLGGMRTGAVGNQYNYIVLAEKTKINFPDVHPDDKTLPSDIGEIKISDISGELIGSKARQSCKDVENPFSSVRVVGPGRLHLAYPDLDYQNTFSYLIQNNWTLSDLNILTEDYERPLKIWSMDIPSGSHTFAIPCYRYETAIVDQTYPIVIISGTYQETYGYRMQNMKVVSNAIETASSENYTVENVHFSFAKGFASNDYYALELESFAAIEKPITSRFVLTSESLTNDQVVTDKGSHVHISQSLSLADLMPEYVADENIQVNAQNLQVDGVVQVQFNNSGEKDLNQKFNIVLFDDLNGNYLFDGDVDTYLGEATITSVPAGVSQSIDIPVYNNIEFPGKSIIAFLDPKSWVAESNKLNNLMVSNLKCSILNPEFEREGDGWKTITAVASQVPDDAVWAQALLTDDNQDQVITDDDFRYLVFAKVNELWAIDANTGNVFFQKAISKLPTKIAVRDLNADGVPEILLDDEIRNAQGDIWIDFNQTSTFKSLDINNDQIWDHIAMHNNCAQIKSGNDEGLLWSGACQGGEPVSSTSFTSLPEMDCYDLGLSYLRIEEGTAETSAAVWVRLASVSTVKLDHAIPLTLYAGDGATKTKIAEILSKDGILPEQYQDVRIPLPSGTSLNQSFSVVIENNTLGNVIYLDANASNSEIKKEVTP